MANYKITIKGKGSTLIQGKNPKDAFAKLYPDVALVMTRDVNLSTVCVELVNGNRKTKNYYVAQTNNVGTKAKQTSTVLYDKQLNNEVEVLVKNYVKAIKSLMTAINNYDESLFEFKNGMENLDIDIERDKDVIDAIFYPGSDGSNLSLPADSETSMEEKCWLERLKKVFPSITI